MRTQSLIVLTASLALFCACDKSSSEPAKKDAAKQPAAKQPAAKQPAPAEPPPAAEKVDPEPPTTAGPGKTDEPEAAPTDGVSAVAEGKKPLATTFGAGASAVTVTVEPVGEYNTWTASFSDGRKSLKLDEPCSVSDEGVFSSLLDITKQGYSAVLNSKVVVFHASHTFDDTGHEEEGPAVLFWRDNKLVCWTGHNTAADDRMPTGLFPN